MLAVLAVVAGALVLAGALPLARLRPGRRAITAATLAVVAVAWAYALVQRGTIVG